MIDIEGTILAIVSDGGGNELAIRTYEPREGVTMIVARTTGTHATWIHKQGTGTTLEQALIECSGRMGIVAPLALNPNLCHICGLELDYSQPFDGHQECREQE